MVYEAESAGVLEEILVDEGASAMLGEPIARLRVGTAPVAVRRRPRAPTASGIRRPPTATRVQRRSRGASPNSSASSSARSRAAGRAGGSSAPTSAAAEPEETGRGFVTVIPQTPTQRTIAQRMSESRSTIPEFTLETEIAMDAVATAREELRAAGADPMPSYNDFVVRAAALALREFPALNASYADGETARGTAASTSASRSPPTTR